MGMAAIGVALYKYVMKFSPKNGSYFNRDRFVLSNGKLTEPTRCHSECQSDTYQDMLACGSTSSCTWLVSKR